MFNILCDPMGTTHYAQIPKLSSLVAQCFVFRGTPRSKQIKLPVPLIKQVGPNNLVLMYQLKETTMLCHS